MGPGEFAALVAGAGGVLTALVVGLYKRGAGRRRQRQMAYWRAMAKHLHLEFSVGTAPDQLAMRGTVEGIEVCIYTEHVMVNPGGAAPGALVTTLRIDSPGLLPEGFRLERQPGLPQGMKPSQARPGQCLGDPEFDGCVRFAGPRQYSLAVLDLATRQVAMQVIGQLGAQVYKRQLICRFAGVEYYTSRFNDALQQGLDLMRRLEVDETELPARLARNMDVDPILSVRRLNCGTLLAHYGLDDQVVADAVHRGHEHPDSGIRVLCAACLSVESAMDVIEPLIYSSKYDPEARMTAVELMVGKFSGPRVEAALVKILAGKVEELQICAAGGLKNTKSQRLVEIGLDALGQPMGPRVLVSLMHNLWPHAGAVTQAHLLGLIQHKDLQVACMAVEGLGRIGTVEAVQSLMAVAEAFLVDKRLDEAVRAAITHIQSRVSGGSAGALSMVQSEQAGLAIVQSESGALSLESGGHNGALSMTTDEGDV